MAEDELALKLARRQAAMDADAPLTDRRVDFSGDESDEISAAADDELKLRLNRRQEINDGKTADPLPVAGRRQNVFAEFSEFSRKQIKAIQETFQRFDCNGDGVLDFDELKRMMEKLDAPQTHLALKEMIRQVDEDRDDKINLREFLLVFRKAAAGELAADSGLSVLADLAAVDVTAEGVGGAKQFFEAKIDRLTRGSAFEAEIRAEQEEKRRELEEKKERREKFREKQSVFNAE